MTITLSKGLALAALVLFIVAGCICFLSTDVSLLHLIGIIAAGLACMAAAAVAA